MNIPLSDKKQNIQLRLVAETGAKKLHAWIPHFSIWGSGAEILCSIKAK